MPWILDTDPGIDDAAAIIGAVRLPFELLGITTVHGNVAADKTLLNALRLKQLLQTDIPVYAGAEKPLLQDAVGAAEVHGDDGLGSRFWPPLSVEAERGHGVNFILEAARCHPGTLNLLAVGPLTNLALALSLNPSLPQAVNRVVIMGGTSQARGNTSMTAEFNFFADPEAAAVVLKAGWHVELVPWEPTLEALIPLSLLPKPGTNLLADAFREIAAPLVERTWMARRLDGLLMCDFAALAVAMDPSVAVETDQVYGAVETGGRYSRGLLALDYTYRFLGPRNLTIVRRLDMAKLQQLFAAMFAG